MQTFLARCPLLDPVPYVREHVLPPLADVPETHLDFEAMAAAFEGWFHGKRVVAPKALVVADCGWPVDTRFLHAVMDRGGEHPSWAPYPLHEVATLLLACGLRQPRGGCVQRSLLRLRSALGAAHGKCHGGTWPHRGDARAVGGVRRRGPYARR